jgi:hypothetical protein
MRPGELIAIIISAVILVVFIIHRHGLSLL